MTQPKVKLTEAMRSLLIQAEGALTWFIDNDETNSGDEPVEGHRGLTWNEMNKFWLDGLQSGTCARDAIREALSQEGAE